jgi:hypothetical protein
MAQSISDSMKSLTAMEKSYIKDVCTTADSDILASIRKLQHINNYLIRRSNQLEALSTKLDTHLYLKDFKNKFDGFDSISKKYTMENNDFGNTLAITKDVVSDEIKKSNLYLKERAELIKNSTTISYYIATTLPEFKSKLKQIINYTG